MRGKTKMFFCSQKQAKQKKSSSPDSTDVNRSNEASNTNLNPIRYVIKKYRPQANQDSFLSVEVRDLVFFIEEDEYQKLTYVYHVPSNQRGYVPSEILATSKAYFDKIGKKKLPSNGCSIVSNSPRILQHPSSTIHSLQQSPVSVGNNILQTTVPKIRLMQQTIASASSTSNDIHTSNTHSSNQKQPFSFFQSHHQQDRACSSGKQSCCHEQHLLSIPGPSSFSDTLPIPVVTKSFVFEQRDYGTYLVLSNFIARQENDIGVTPFETVRVLNKDDSDWYWVVRECDGDEGFVPSSYLCRFDRIEDKIREREAYSSDATRSVNNDSQPTYINTL